MKIKNDRIQRLAIVMGTILALSIPLLLIVIGNLPESLVQYVDHTIGYKGLLIILIWLLFAFLLSIFYYRTRINHLIVQINETDRPPPVTPPTDDEFLKQFKDILEILADDEKILLKEFMVQNKSVVYRNMRDGVAQNLCMKKILFPTTKTALPPNYNVGYGIQPIVKKCLSLYPELLD